jgi:hypothetical protein
MANYANDIKQAQAAIKEAGQLVTWRKLPRNPDSLQPWKEVNPPPAPLDYPVYLLYLSGSLSNAFRHLMQNTDVTEGAFDAIIAGGLTFTPELTDTLITPDETLVISDIDSLAPDGTVIIWYLRFQ